MALVQWWDGFVFLFFIHRFGATPQRTVPSLSPPPTLQKPLPRTIYRLRFRAHQTLIGARGSPVALIVRDRQVRKEESERKMKTEKFAE